MGLSWWHILFVLAVFVLLFGAGRISGLMSDLAKGLRSFNKAMAEEDDDERRGVELIENKGTMPRRRTAPRVKRS